MKAIVATSDYAEGESLSERLFGLFEDLHVDQVPSLKDALAALRRAGNHPDLVVIDTEGMAGVRARRALRSLRDRLEVHQVPLVAICSGPPEGCPAHDLFTQIVRKPVGERKFEEIAKNYLRRHLRREAPAPAH
ncbi:MAG: hypothetical protein AB1405_05200 [Bdellovibrionota bacterium]